MRTKAIAGKPTAFHERMVAMNEALVLGSVRQHELADTSERLNERLRLEILERKAVEETLRKSKEALQESQQQIERRAQDLEKEVTKRTADLQATNQQLEAFVYSIAHDLRAPLRSMQGFSTLLVETAGASLDDTGRDYAARIDKAAQFMDAMLVDLLAFSRISQQRVELAPVNLQSVLQSVLSRLEEDIEFKKARVEAVGPWPVVLAHEATLSQVLFNLVSNALKFVQPGTPPVVSLRTEEREGRVRVWVEDHGPGIAANHLGQIFRLFLRLEGEKHPGTGVGLAIVQKGVERMGGQVGVESVVGEGSRFWFDLQKPAETGPPTDVAPILSNR